MGRLGNLFYDVTLKDSTAKGLSSIQQKIKRMSATISPKISAPDLNRQIKDATSKLKVANIQVNVVANTGSLGANIQAAVNAGTYVARIGADTNGLIQTIQEAINKATFTAKVAKVDITTSAKGKNGAKGNEQTVAIKADTSTLAASIQKAVSAQAYVAKINADTNGFVSAVQSALAASSFTAKVNIDKTALTNATQGKKRADGTSATQSRDSSYSVDVKARATTLRQSIKEAINGGEYKVNIEAKAQNLRKSINDAIKSGDYKAKIEANTSAIQKGVRDALKTGEYVAKIGADASGIVSTIQKAITASSFTAKVNLDNSAFSRTGKNANLADPKKNVQTYSVDVTAKASSLQKSIKDAIKAGEYKVKIGADTSMLANAIQRYINQQTFTAKVSLTNQSSITNQKKKAEEVTDTTKKSKKNEPIKVDVKVDASSAPKTIQDTINSKNYTAKVGADTTRLVDAINKAIPQERKIQITGAVSGGNTGTSGGTTSGSTSSNGGTKSSNDAKAAQRAIDRQNKIEEKAYENHLKGMQKMRDTYEKDKWVAIRKMGMSAPKADATTVSLGSGNGARNVDSLVNRILGIKETIRQYRGEIAKLDKANGQLVKKIGSGPIMGMKKEIMNMELQYNLSWIQAYKNEIQSLERQYRALSKISIQQPQRYTLPSTFVGYGGTPANHNTMQKQWEEHFAWKDREMKQTTAGNMRMSADDAKKAAEAARREAIAANEAKAAEEAKKMAIKAAAEQRRLAAQEAKRYATEMQRVASEMNTVGSRSGWLRDQLQNVFSMYGVQQFLQNLILIGGEFEKQKIALGSIFKNTAKGNETFEQIKQWSVKSPFTFSNLTSYTKQLASFGFQYRDVFDTTKKLADISAGVGVDMSRIILAYGQVYTAHYLRGQELRQFTEAGIPMVDELSKVLTERMGRNVSAGDVFKLISDKQVEFEDVKKVIDKLTDEGGTFYKMQEKQSESLAGKWTNLKDAVEIMYSDIEASNNGLLKGSISLLTKLALAWKGVGAVVGAVAGAYGLLALKRRMVASAGARETAAIASANAKTAAINKQTAAYNELAAAISNKNAQESYYGANGTFRTATTWSERANARNMAVRAVYNGVDPRTITPFYSGERKRVVDANGNVTWDKNAGQDKIFVGQTSKWSRLFGGSGAIKKARELTVKMKWLKREMSLATSSSKKFGIALQQALTSTQIGWNKAIFSIKAFSATMLTTMASMLPMLTIMGAISGGMYLWQKSNEEEQRNNDIIEGTKSSYKELLDFINANPIELTIKGGNYSDIASLIEKYEEEIRNSPINIDFAILQTRGIADLGERLQFLKQKLQEVAEAEMWLKDNSLGLNKKVEDDTNGWFDDAYYTNIKDFIKKTDAYQASVSKINDNDIDKLLKDLKELSPITKKDEKNINALIGKISILRKEGAGISKIIETIADSKFKNSRLTPFVFGNVFKDAFLEYEKYKTAKTDKDEDAKTAYEDFYKSIEGNSKALFNGGLTDFGHDLLVGWVKNFGQAHEMMDSEVNQMISDLEQRSKPAVGAAWQTSTQSMNELVDRIKAKYASLFEGGDISKGLTKQQHDAIQEIIRNAPAECKQYTSEWQRNLDNNKLAMVIGVRFNMVGNGDIPSSVQDAFDRNVGTTIDNRYGSYRPQREQSWSDYNAARTSSLETKRIELKNLKAKKNKNAKDRQDIKISEKSIADEEYAFKNTSPYGYSQYVEERDKKDKQKENKAKAAAEKAKRQQEERQRKYEASLRKEFNQIKRVKDMYEKLRGLYGDVGALEKIRKSGLVKADIIPDNVTNLEQFMKKYEAILKKFKNNIKGNTEAIKEIKDQVSQDLFNLFYDKDKEALDKAVSTLETQLERAGEAWTRYKNLLSEGVNMPLAKFMVYGSMGDYNMVETDDTGSQRLSMLRERAAKHIEEKTNTSPSEYNMDRYLGMNEEELKTEFGNNEEVTKGLWAIVKTYQEAAKNIRSENDKLISQLYKDSLSYAGQMESIARKHKSERATIKEMQVGYAPAKQRYDKAVQQGANIEGRLKYQQGLANSSKEYKDWSLANATYNTQKEALDWHDQQVKEGEKPTTNRKDLQKRVNEAKTAADTAWNVYIQTDAYKGIAPLEEEQKKNQEEQKIAQEKLSETLSPEVANGLLAQSKINERKDKSEVSVKMLEGSDGYIELFNNIYNLASDKANDIADELIRILDEKLAKGEITQEAYTNARNEISQKRNEVYEKGSDSKNAKLWQVGFGGITKNKIQQAQAEQEAAGKQMNSIQTQIDQNNATITSDEKKQKLDNLNQQMAEAKNAYNNAGTEADKKIASDNMAAIGREIEKTQNTSTVTEEDRTARGILLNSQMKAAKKRYDEADEQGNAAAKKQAKQDMIQGGFDMAANMGQNLTQFRDTLGGTLDSLGLDTENNAGFQKFSTAVDVMSDVSSGMSNAVQSMMSGDFFGAAMSIVETPLNIITAFNKLHDKKLDIQINQSKELMQEVQTAADELKNAIQDSLGADDAKQRAMSRQGEMSQILKDAGVEDTIGAGLVYDLVSGKKSGSDAISENRNKYYGKKGKVTDQEYRKKFMFGKFLLNTVGLTASQPVTAATTMFAGATADATANTATGGMAGPTGTALAATKVASDSVVGLVKAVKGSFKLVRNEEAKAYTRMAEALETAQFGKHETVSVYGAQYAALLEQRKQAEYQMKLEQDKKDTDDDKIKEQRKTIQDLNNQIHEYISNLAKELYGIDFSSWANKLGDALTNAFRNGEDAAAAFHDSVSDIMADIVKNMLITDAIKPMFSKLEETLFGEDGKGNGMIDMNDMEGSIQKAVPYINDFFKTVENNVPGWEKFYEVMNEATGGILKKTSSSSSSMSGSIKGITEETSTLLASYINAIRLDVSVNRKTFKDLAEVTIPKMSVIAENQLRQLNIIAEQTTKIEENTRRNAESVDMIKSYISSVSTTTSGGKAIRMKA